MVNLLFRHVDKRIRFNDLEKIAKQDLIGNKDDLYKEIAKYAKPIPGNPTTSATVSLQTKQTLPPTKIFNEPEIKVDLKPWPQATMSPQTHKMLLLKEQRKEAFLAYLSKANAAPHLHQPKLYLPPPPPREYSIGVPRPLSGSGISFDEVQTIAEFAGSFPVVGEPIDFVNGLVYFLRGKNFEGSVSMTAVFLPFASQLARGGARLLDVGNLRFLGTFDNIPIRNVPVGLSDHIPEGAVALRQTTDALEFLNNENKVIGSWQFSRGPSIIEIP